MKALETVFHPKEVYRAMDTNHLMYHMTLRIKEKLKRHLNIKCWDNKLSYERSCIEFIRNELNFVT